MKKKVVRDSKQDLPFAPVQSKITIDLSPKTFKHSDEFSKKMDRAYRHAMRQNLAYSSRQHQR